VKSERLHHGKYPTIPRITHQIDAFDVPMIGKAIASKINFYPDTGGSFWRSFMSLLYLAGFLLVLG
jgi:hypothetical protein